MALSADQIVRGNWIVRELLAKQKLKDSLELWGDIAGYFGKEEAEQKHIANAFLLACLLDYRRRDDSWAAVSKFLSRYPEFRNDIWRVISETPQQEWKAASKQYNLHWESRPHNRLWPIAVEIVYWFGGDARCIWSDGNAINTLTRLYWIGAGEQISRMIVGALKDCGIVSGKSDPKGDVRVCRVVGRSILGMEIDPTNASKAIRICREIHPTDPWKLDGPHYLLGEICRGHTPDCRNCYLREKCAYYATTIIPGAGDGSRK